MLGATAASATPVTYVFVSGNVTLWGESSGVQVGGPANVSLSGVAVTVDVAGSTVPSLAFAVGSTGTIPVTYGTFTTFNLDFATVNGVGGTLALVAAGPPDEYGFNMSVNLAGQFDANSPLPPVTISNAPFFIPGAAATGSIFIDGSDLILSSFTIGSIDPDGPGGLEPLDVKGDFTFVGTVPEPGTAILLGVGLAGVAARARRRGAAQH
jgi:hypothetical protein